MKQIELSRNLVVDDEDFAFLSQWSLYALVAEVRRLRVPNCELLAEVERLQQVASGNDERIALLAKKHDGRPFDAARLAALQDIRRILRRLVREAAIMGHGEIDSLGTLSEQREQADRIAKELVP